MPTGTLPTIMMTTKQASFTVVPGVLGSLRLDTIPGIDPGPLPSPIPGPFPDPDPDFDPESDPDPTLPTGPETPGIDPGFPSTGLPGSPVFS